MYIYIYSTCIIINYDHMFVLAFDYQYDIYNLQMFIVTFYSLYVIFFIPHIIKIMCICFYHSVI